MKKIFLAVALAVLGAFMVQAEESSELSFRQLRKQAVNQERADSIKSVRAVYYYKYDDNGMKEAVFMIRAKKDNKVRIDFLVGGELYTTMRNGNEFWNYEKSTGLTKLNDEESSDFMQVVSFLALPFCTEDVFTNPVKVGEDTMKNKEKTPRDIYEMKTKDSFGVSYKVFFEQKTSLLRRIECIDTNGKPVVVLFSNYKDYNGIKVPGTMSVSNRYGFFTRRVATVDWNIELDDSVFSPKYDGKDRDLKLLMDLPGEYAKTENTKVNQNQARIEKLEREIRILKLEIADSEKRLGQMEHVVTKQYDTVTGLAAITGSSHSRRHYWGWSSSSYDGAANRDSRNRRSIIRDATNNIDKVATDYKRLNKKLLEQRIKLGDKELVLEKLKKNAAKLEKEEMDGIEE